MFPNGTGEQLQKCSAAILKSFSMGQCLHRVFPFNNKERMAKPLVFEYLEAFYNTKRIHIHCNYMSLNDFEQLYEKSLADGILLAG